MQDWDKPSLERLPQTTQRRLVKVAKATVTLPVRGGQGILVRGNLIVTAAHCLEWAAHAPETLAECPVETIRTAAGGLKVAAAAIEACSDIAVLGALDSQRYPEEAAQFEQFCAVTRPVRLCTRRLALFQPFRVYVLTHRGKWVSGTTTQMTENAALLCYRFDEPIEPGTSGGPIVTEQGELLGIVSLASVSGTGDPAEVVAPRPSLALPAWVCWRTAR